VTWDDGAYNFRDLGGLPTEDGRVTRHGVLYRSATLHDLGPETAAVLREEYGISCVVDLRTPDEIAAQGGTSASAWVGKCLALPVQTPPLPAAGGPEDLLSRYFEYLERSTPNIIGVLRHVSRGDAGAVVVHCTSGKDRTGVVISLLLRLLGVTRDAVAEDYAATAANITAVMERLGRCGPRPLLARDIPPGILEAGEKTIRAFLEQLEGRFGSVEAWALERGLDQPDVDALQATFIRSIQ
jgi:protein-tyrosine phosphatase